MWRLNGQGVCLEVTVEVAPVEMGCSHQTEALLSGRLRKRNYKVFSAKMCTTDSIKVQRIHNSSPIQNAADYES